MSTENGNRVSPPPMRTMPRLPMLSVELSPLGAVNGSRSNRRPESSLVGWVVVCFRRVASAVQQP